MGMIGILLLVGGAMAGLMGLGTADIDEEALGERASGNDPQANDDLMVGTDGTDVLDGGAGGDWLLGLDGDDTLTGGTGGDVIIPGIGTDMVQAGSGNDFVEAANVVDETALRSSATTADTIFDVDFDYALPALSDEGDRVDLGDGDDTVVAGSYDSVTGGEGADEFALGDWIEGGKPVEIDDFDEAEDIITFVYDSNEDAPDMTVERNETTGMTTIKANGETIAVLRDTSPAFSVRNVAVGRYTA